MLLLVPFSFGSTPLLVRFSVGITFRSYIVVVVVVVVEGKPLPLPLRVATQGGSGEGFLGGGRMTLGRQIC